MGTGAGAGCAGPATVGCRGTTAGANARPGSIDSPHGDVTSGALERLLFTTSSGLRQIGEYRQPVDRSLRKLERRSLARATRTTRELISTRIAATRRAAPARTRRARR